MWWCLASLDISLGGRGLLHASSIRRGSPPMCLTICLVPPYFPFFVQVTPGGRHKWACKYRFYSEFQSHEPEFDYLKSLEIEEKINQIKWCRKTNGSHFLITANGTYVLSACESFTTARGFNMYWFAVHHRHTQIRPLSFGRFMTRRSRRQLLSLPQDIMKHHVQDLVVTAWITEQGYLRLYVFLNYIQQDQS